MCGESLYIYGSSTIYDKYSIVISGPPLRYISVFSGLRHLLVVSI